MKKIIARLMAAAERISGVAREEAAKSREQGLGLAADELELLAQEIEHRGVEYRMGLALVEPAEDKQKEEKAA